MRKLLFIIIPASIFITAIGVYLKPKPAPEAPKLKNITEHMAAFRLDAPPSLTFCNQEVPVDRDAVKAKLDQEISKYVEAKSGISLIARRAFTFKTKFLPIMEQYGIPADFFYLAIAESNLSNATSPVGAKGFWQFMAPTARQYGLEVSETVDERYHPEKATKAACRYLKTHYKELNDWALVAAAYNMGVGGLNRTMKAQGINDYFALDLNDETGDYLYRILAFKSILENPGRYGLDGLGKSGLSLPRYKQVEVQENIADLATFAATNGATFREIKTLNPWLIANRLEVSPGKTYRIRLPLVSQSVVEKLKEEKIPETPSTPTTTDTIAEEGPSKEEIALQTEKNPEEDEGGIY
ncbi:MAG: lytic transglycosylase domain-containing protein [Bacteroidota bacterium]